jgi:hypothetical protein
MPIAVAAKLAENKMEHMHVWIEFAAQLIERTDSRRAECHGARLDLPSTPPSMFAPASWHRR